MRIGPVEKTGKNLGQTRGSENQGVPCGGGWSGSNGGNGKSLRSPWGQETYLSPLEFRYSWESLLGFREWFEVLEWRMWLGVPKEWDMVCGRGWL